jgi:hypothetical protein
VHGPVAGTVTGVAQGEVSALGGGEGGMPVGGQGRAVGYVVALQFVWRPAQRVVVIIV